MSFRRWLKRVEDNTWDKRAFNCHRCPESGCPAWTTMHVLNPDSGSLEEVSGCSFLFIPQLFSETLAKNDDVRRQQAAQTATIKQSTVVLGRLMQNVTTHAALPPADEDIIDAEPTE